MAADVIPQLVRRARVQDITGLSKSEIYRRVKAGTFPVPVSINEEGDDYGRGTRWVLAEVVAWTQERIKQRTTSPSAAGKRRDDVGRFSGTRLEALGP